MGDEPRSLLQNDHPFDVPAAKREIPRRALLAELDGRIARRLGRDGTAATFMSRNDRAD
jgi:hypothetical protein